MTEKYVKKIPDLINMGFWQFAGCLAAVLICMALFDSAKEGVWYPGYWMPSNLLQIAYLILIPTVFSFLMQIICQKEVGSFKASLIFALEAPFASFFAMAFYGETLTGIEALGGLILFLTSVIPEAWLDKTTRS
jgi:drug/metabolite transporter (DMT)-like permease